MTVIVSNLAEAGAESPTYLAIGSFDGVHRGHQAILQAMVAAARRDGVRAAVLTFFPHPKRVVLNLTGRYYLTTLAERERLLAAAGVDLIISHRFDEVVRHTRAADFVGQLVRHLALRQLWGGNFALGYQREGDIPFLRRLGQELNYTVNVVESLVEHEGELVSSSRIRQRLADGDMADVTGCLGRPYRLSGAVTMGQQRGRVIGFPTANLAVWEEQLLPAHGVYATRATVNGRSYPSATNVGIRPTVDGQTLTVETHLLGFSGDLYGQSVTLDFIARIRPERRFDGLDALKAQIARDVAAVHTLLTESQTAQ